MKAGAGALLSGFCGDVFRLEAPHAHPAGTGGHDQYARPPHGRQFGRSPPGASGEIRPSEIRMDSEGVCPAVSSEAAGGGPSVHDGMSLYFGPGAFCFFGQCFSAHGVHEVSPGCAGGAAVARMRRHQEIRAGRQPRPGSLAGEKGQCPVHGSRRQFPLGGSAISQRLWRL